MDLTKFISFVSLWYTAAVEAAKQIVFNEEQLKSLYKKQNEWKTDQMCREGFRPLNELEALKNKMKNNFFNIQSVEDSCWRFELDLFTSKLFGHCDFIFDGEKIYIDPATRSNEIKNAMSTSGLNNFDFSIQAFRSRNGSN